METVGDLIGRGFGTWRQNLNLCLPFLLSFILSMLVVIIILASFAASFAPLESLNSTSVEKVQDLLPALEPALEEALPALVLAFALLIFLLSLVSAFFTAGAVGMAVQALETGRATTGAMWSAGRRHFANMFLTSILMGIMTVAGTIFLLPGIVLLPSSLQPDPKAVGTLLIGLVLLIIYAVAMSLILALAPYALVVDSFGPVRAVRASVNFFNYNKFDVLVLWLVVVALSLGLQMVGSAVSAGNTIGFQPLSAVTGLLSLLVLSPLATVWWTRLYMDRTGRLKETLKDDEM